MAASIIDKKTVGYLVIIGEGWVQPYYSVAFSRLFTEGGFEKLLK